MAFAAESTPTPKRAQWNTYTRNTPPPHGLRGVAATPAASSTVSSPGFTGALLRQFGGAREGFDGPASVENVPPCRSRYSTACSKGQFGLTKISFDNQSGSANVAANKTLAKTAMATVTAPGVEEGRDFNDRALAPPVVPMRPRIDAFTHSRRLRSRAGRASSGSGGMAFL
jgi:hypothetical protein